MSEDNPGQEAGAINATSGQDLGRGLTLDDDTDDLARRVERDRRRARLRAGRQLDTLLRRMHAPAPPARPSTFSLSKGELRNEANRLVTEGWSIAEVQQVLDVERAP
jgi:hypothetical protein